LIAIHRSHHYFLMPDSSDTTDFSLAKVTIY
jgi:hypothetical protein